MERKIGEIFKVDGVKLKCLKYLDDCTDCYFFEKPEQCDKQSCLKFERSDGECVYFKEIKEKL